MKAAIIGTGGIAHTHANAMRALGVELSLVVGHSMESAHRFAVEYGCPQFTDHLTAATLDEIDTVHICTPPESHFEQVTLCLNAGKHVLCEKPLSLSTSEALQLDALAEKTGSITAVDFNNRFYPSAGEMRRLASQMGPVLLVHGHYFQEFHMLPCAYSWRYTEPLRAAGEIGSHFLDQLRFFTGQEVQSLSAVFLNAVPNRVLRDGMMYESGEGAPLTVKSEDAVAATLRLTGGGVVSCLLSEISPGRSNDLSLELVCPRGSVSWCSETPYEVVTGNRGEGMTCRRNAFSGGFTDTFTDCFAAFYEAVQTGERDPRLATFRDGAVNAKLVDALAQSARSGGRWIDVQEDGV